MSKTNEKEIIKKVEGEKWEQAKEKAFQKANKKAKIDGFRPGKAPKDIFIKKYGEESLWMDAAEIVLDSAYEEMLEDAKDIEIVARPDIAVKNINKDGVEFSFTLTLKPEVKLGKYKGLKVKKESVTVTKEEIEEAISELRNRYAENMPKEGKAENGDIAIIDFKGTKDGVAFDGGTAENYSLTLGSHTFIPGFEEGIVGMKIGEEKDLKLKFPDNYHSEDLKGQEVNFHVVLNDLKTVVVPELNEEFFEDLGMEGVNSKETLEKEIKENMEKQKEVNAENKYMDDLLEEALKGVQVEVPHAMIHDEIERMIGQFEERLHMQGVTLDQFLKMTNAKLEDLKAQMHEEAEKRVKLRLMLEEIAKVEKIELSDDKAKEEAKKLAEKYQMKEEDFLREFGGLDMVKYDYKMRQAMEMLKEEDAK